jgi:hypothetical protein
LALIRRAISVSLCCLPDIPAPLTTCILTGFTL